MILDLLIPTLAAALAYVVGVILIRWLRQGTQEFWENWE